jgi:hypothetical protein
MTPVIASSHHPPAGKPCFRRRIAVGPPPPKSRTTPSIMPSRLVDRRRGEQTPDRNRQSIADYAGQRIPYPSLRLIKST